MAQSSAPEILAIIPARGGSVGVPGKNVRLLGGVPLIAHTIHAALSARSVRRLVVSTDDAEIASKAREHGAEVIMRPPELSTGAAKSEDALLHVIDYLEKEERYRPEAILFLQCTSPLTTADDIDGVVNALFEAQADSALSVALAHHFLWRRSAEGEAIGVNHDKSFRQMRQEREPEFLETGAVYAMRTEGFRVARHRFFGRTVMHVVPAEHTLEIDEPEDFRIAEDRVARLARSARKLPFFPAALIMDFDGVFTDDRVFVDQDGRESVVCSRSDGMGLEGLRRAGLPMFVVSKEQNSIVAARCRKLQIPCEYGVEEKLDLVRAWAARDGHDAERVIYVGNDRNDVECMKWAGLGVAPRDAHGSALAVADLILEANGGRGALRLLADMILEAQTADRDRL